MKSSAVCFIILLLHNNSFSFLRKPCDSMAPCHNPNSYVLLVTARIAFLLFTLQLNCAYTESTALLPDDEWRDYWKTCNWKGRRKIGSTNLWYYYDKKKQVGKNMAADGGLAKRWPPPSSPSPPVKYPTTTTTSGCSWFLTSDSHLKANNNSYAISSSSSRSLPSTTEHIISVMPNFLLLLVCPDSSSSKPHFPPPSFPLPSFLLFLWRILYTLPNSLL